MPKNGKTKHHYSLMDEQLASITKTFDERLLLWRPRYAELQPVAAPADNLVPVAEPALRAIIKDLLQQRRTAQDLLELITPQLRREQTDSFAPLGLVLPRYPSPRKSEDSLLERYQPAAGLVLATSLVTNCAANWRVEAGVLEDTVAVGTIVGEYREFGTRATRLVVLETPGSHTLQAALEAGRGFTRLCEMNAGCRESLRGEVN